MCHIRSYLIFLEHLKPSYVVYHERVDIEEEKLLHGLFSEIENVRVLITGLATSQTPVVYCSRATIRQGGSNPEARTPSIINKSHLC